VVTPSIIENVLGVFGSGAAGQVGRPGAKEVRFWVDGSNIYRCEVERDSAGRVRTCRSSLEGKRNQRLEAAAQREAELRLLKEKIEEAKP
jgi:hypothetical protein